jgi:hypothetical protein
MLLIVSVIRRQFRGKSMLLILSAVRILLQGFCGIWLAKFSFEHNYGFWSIFPAFALGVFLSWSAWVCLFDVLIRCEAWLNRRKRRKGQSGTDDQSQVDEQSGTAHVTNEQLGADHD